MLILKLIAKIVLLPVMIAVILVQWIGIFLTGLAGGIFGLLSILFALVAGASFLFGIASGLEALKCWLLDLCCLSYRICRADHYRDYCSALQSY